MNAFIGRNTGAIAKALLVIGAVTCLAAFVLFMAAPA